MTGGRGTAAALQISLASETGRGVAAHEHIEACPHSTEFKPVNIGFTQRGPEMAGIVCSRRAAYANRRRTHTMFHQSQRLTQRPRKTLPTMPRGVGICMWRVTTAWMVPTRTGFEPEESQSLSTAAAVHFFTLWVRDVDARGSL
jgi:hypothetical protein